MSDKGIAILGVLGLLYLAHRNQNTGPASANVPRDPATVKTPVSSSVSATPPITFGGGGGGVSPVDNGPVTQPAVYWPSNLDPFDASFFTQNDRPTYRQQYLVGPGVIDAGESEQ